MSSNNGHPVASAIVRAGIVVGVLDAIDAIIAFKVVAGFDPVSIYQFVASGILGKDAFSGGLATAALGLVIHFVIAFAAAAAYVLAARKLPALTRPWWAWGATYGIGIYAVMNYVVIPSSRIAPSPFSLPLFLNGVIGHALLVGLPVAFYASNAIPNEDR